MRLRRTLRSFHRSTGHVDCDQVSSWNSLKTGIKEEIYSDRILEIAAILGIERTMR